MTLLTLKSVATIINIAHTVIKLHVVLPQSGIILSLYCLLYSV